MRKLMDKRICPIVLGLAASLFGGNAAFGQDDLGEYEGTAKKMFQTFSNSSTLNTENGAYMFSGNIGASMGSDDMYMRRGQSLSGGEATSQINQAVQTEQGFANSYYSQSVPEKNRVFWVTPYFSSFNAYTGHNEEISPQVLGSSDFETRRIGFMGGVNTTNSSDLNGGLFIGYAKSDMWQNVFLKPTDQGVESITITPDLSFSDFQFGGQLKYRFSSGVYAIATVTGGAQDYRWKRRNYQTFNDGRDPLEALYIAGTTGHTLVANLKLAKNYELGGNWSITPSVAVESGNSWLYRVAESGGYGHYTNSEYAGADEDTKYCWAPYRLNRHLRYGRVTGRVGADLAYSDENMGFNVGAFYGTQVAGRDGALVSIKHMKEDKKSADMYGNGFGRDTLDCNAGIWSYLNQARTARISGLYSIRCYSQATSQVMGATYTLNF